MSIQLKEITLPSMPATYAQEFFAAVSAANDPTKTYIYEVANANLSNIRSAAFHHGEKLNARFRVFVLPTPTKQGHNLAVSLSDKPIIRRPRKAKVTVVDTTPEPAVVEDTEFTAPV